MYSTYYAKMKKLDIKYPLSVVSYPPKYLPEIPCAKELGCPKALFRMEIDWSDPEVEKAYHDAYYKFLDHLSLEGIINIIKKYYPNAPIEEITFMSFSVEPDQRGIICEWLSDHGYPSKEL